MAEKVRRKRQVTRLEVLRTEWLTPHLLRVVAGGPGLGTFVDNDFTDRYVKIVFRRPGVDYPEPFDMDAVHERLPRDQWPVLRTYTIRYHRPEAGELAIDFVYHGEEGLAGPWAAGLKPGDEVLFLGPGGAYAPDPTADWHLLVGDEAALPAIASSLHRIPAGRPVHVLCEIGGPEERIALAETGTTRLRWLYRGDSPTLPEAVEALDFPAGRVHAFVHGEAGMVKRLRRHLLRERGLSKDQLSISGYWRLGMDDEAFRIAKRAEREAEAAGGSR